VLSKLAIKHKVVGDNKNEEQTHSIENAKHEDKIENPDELDFIHLLAPNINVDADKFGNVLFKRNEYGLVIIRQELIKLVSEQLTVADIYQEIKAQALYKYSNAEMKGTDGLLALGRNIKPPTELSRCFERYSTSRRNSKYNRRHPNSVSKKVYSTKRF
jgi:hypothetical protein